MKVVFVLISVVSKDLQEETGHVISLKNAHLLIRGGGDEIRPLAREPSIGDRHVRPRRQMPLFFRSLMQA
jgi:hypothetical protein